jgi:hypothetical protein
VHNDFSIESKPSTFRVLSPSHSQKEWRPAKKFQVALEGDLGPLISEMEAVLGEMTIPGGTTVRPITAGEKALYEMEGKALAHLTKTCTGLALHYISNSLTAHAIWTVLKTKYARSELLLDFSTIVTAYNTKVLEQGEDPDLLLKDLELLNTKLERTDPKYKKADLTIRVHIVNRLTPEYQTVCQKYSNELETGQHHE